MDQSHHQRLRGAAQAGNIDELYALIREDAYLLDGIDQIPFFDTPLHIAAAAGHTDFAMEIMNLKPSLALKLNNDGFSPIHIALQNGQKETVLDLLGLGHKDILRVKGKEGKTPLHFVVGEAVDVSLILTFLLCCPECIRDVTNRNETALHIAAQKNLLEVVQVLIGWLKRTDNKDGKLWEKEVLNWKNKEGDTVLHIAVSNNQPEMIRLLLESGIDKNAKNWRGLTAMDTLPDKTKDDNQETLKILSHAKCLNASSITTYSTYDKFLRSKITFVEKSNVVMSRMRKNLSDGTRDALLVVLVLILTATYQSAVNPPFEIGQASLQQGTDNNEPPPPPPPSFSSSPPSSSSTSFFNNIYDWNDLVELKVDGLGLSFSIVNAVAFLVTLLVTLLILPWVPCGNLLHVLLLIVFVLFVGSMGLAFALTTSNIGIVVFGVFVVITAVVGILIVMNKIRSRKYKKEFGDRVRLREHQDINKEEEE